MLKVERLLYIKLWKYRMTYDVYYCGRSVLDMGVEEWLEIKFKMRLQIDCNDFYIFQKEMR